MRAFVHNRCVSQRGFTIVEIMVAMAIALFLLAGLMTIVGSTRNTFGKQNQLTQLQDNERMALTVIGDIVQQAGYFPDPTTNSSSYLGMTPLNALNGSYNVNAQGDTLTVNYVTRSTAVGVTDGVLNCSGLANTSGADVLTTNIFSVTPAGMLNCNMNGTDYPLVSGVQKLEVFYGVNMGSACGNCVETYLNATQVTNNGTGAGGWASVISAKIRLTLTNPLYIAGGDNQKSTIVIERVVPAMNRGGVFL